MTERPAHASRIGEGAYRVETDGGVATVYVAGAPGERWAWANGRMYRETRDTGAATVTRASRAGAPQAIHAPMPAKIVSVTVTPGAQVAAGDTLVVIEAMKMEWPLKAESAGTVTAVHGAPGELVAADALLVEIA
jgi:biotin carboxyl carrier protein